MTATRSLDEALDALGGTGTAVVEGEGGKAEVDCAEIDAIGVRVDRLRVTRDTEVDVVRETAALPARARSLGERLRSVEVDPRLGGATLRTDPTEIRDRE